MVILMVALIFVDMVGKLKNPEILQGFCDTIANGYVTLMSFLQGKKYGIF